MGWATIATVALSATLHAALAHADGPGLQCPSAWHEVDSTRRTPPGGRFLAGVTEGQDDDAWAVGSWAEHALSSESRHPLVEHWDGHAWIDSREAATALPSRGNLSDVWSARGALWVAGTQLTGSGDQPLVARLDTTGWDDVPMPESISKGTLAAISGTGPDDVWAVGTDLDSQYQRGLVLHWDGTAWSRRDVPSPKPDGNAALTDVVAVSSTDVWVSGFGADSSYPDNVGFVGHWNGIEWSITQFPAARFLPSVAASPNDVWAVGYGDSTAVAMHWDGFTWSSMEPPTPDGWNPRLTQVTPAGGGGVVVVGDYSSDTTLHGAPYIQRWDGSAWTTEYLGSREGYLSGLTVGSNGERWAVGSDELDTIVLGSCEGAGRPESVSANGPYAGDWGQDISLSAYAIDPDPDDGINLTFGWDLDHDGVFEVGPSTSNTLVASFRDPGTQPISVRVCHATACARAQTFVSVQGHVTALEPRPVLGALPAGELRARLSDGPIGPPLAGRPVVFRIGSQEACRVLTDADGVAHCRGLAVVARAVAANGFEVSFAGEPPRYTGARRTGTLI